VITPKGHFKNHEKFFKKFFKNPLTTPTFYGIIYTERKREVNTNDKILKENRPSH
jgi:hypothetical protein